MSFLPWQENYMIASSVTMGAAMTPLPMFVLQLSGGVKGWIGAMIRLSDKVQRLKSLAQTGQLANEGAKDSFMDIAVYALIAHVLFEQDE
jgi:hypothetical protein